MKLSTLFSAYQEAAQACEQLRAARCMNGRNKSIGAATDVAARQWQRRHRQAETLIVEIEERILDIEEIPAHGPIGSMFKRIHYEATTGMESYPDPSGLVVALMEEVGELARAMMSEPRENIRAEAVQVAALAIRIAIEGDPTLDGIREKNDADFPLPPILVYGP